MFHAASHTKVNEVDGDAKCPVQDRLKTHGVRDCVVGNGYAVPLDFRADEADADENADCPTTAAVVTIAARSSGRESLLGAVRRP